MLYILHYDSFRIKLINQSGEQKAGRLTEGRRWRALTSRAPQVTEKSSSTVTLPQVYCPRLRPLSGP